MKTKPNFNCGCCLCKLFSARTLLLLSALLVYQVGALAQELPENEQNAPNGLVYFLRGKGFAGSATAFSAIIDDTLVCKLNNRRYSAHQVSPGKHEFKAQFAGKKGKKKAEIAIIDVEAGQTYYIQMVMQASFFVNDLTAQEITRNSALRLIEDDEIQLDKDCKVEIIE
jgi:hypothetical protein